MAMSFCVSPFDKFTLFSELGEHFLHGLAGSHARCVGVQICLLLHSLGVCVCPLLMHVQGSFHSGEVHGIGTVYGPGEIRHGGGWSTVALEHKWYVECWVL